jgi:NhaP-type Na+/H+ or K+/H+ antiporter
METFILGVATGVFIGYAIRALISYRRRRRVEAEYGYNSSSYLR